MIYDRVKTRSNSPLTTEGSYSDNVYGTLTFTSTMEMPDNYTYGVSIPNFHKRKAAGQLLPHTDFSQFQLDKVNFEPVSARTERGSTKWWVSGYFPNRTTPVIYHAADTSRSSDLVQSAAAAISSSGFDAMTAIAELSSLARMLKSVGDRALKLVTKRGKKSDNDRYLSPQQIHQAWLEGRYGWRILAYDIRDLHEALTEYDSSRKIWSERQGFSYTDVSHGTNAVPFANVGVYGYLQSTWTAETTHSIRGAVSALASPGRFYNDPLQTGWELLPFSFVLDWAVQVGQALQAHRLVRIAKGISASAGYKSTTVYREISSGLVGLPYNMKVIENPSGLFEYQCTRTFRTPTSVPTKPILSSDFADPLWLVDLQALYRARAIAKGGQLKRVAKAYNRRLEQANLALDVD